LGIFRTVGGGSCQEKGIVPKRSLGERVRGERQNRPFRKTRKPLKKEKKKHREKNRLDAKMGSGLNGKKKRVRRTEKGPRPARG